jgi:hypothetical protein
MALLIVTFAAGVALSWYGMAFIREHAMGGFSLNIPNQRNAVLILFLSYVLLGIVLNAIAFRRFRLYGLTILNAALLGLSLSSIAYVLLVIVTAVLA